MKKTRFLLPLALALTLPAVGARTDQTTGSPSDQGTAVQAPAAGDTLQQPQPDPARPDTAPPDPAQPGQADPAQPAPTPADPAQPAPGAPDPLQPDRLPQQPDQPQPDQPQQQPVQPDQPEQQPAQPDQPMAAPDPSAMPAGMTLNPLQEFVSHQAHEIGMLSQQMDLFKAADRNDVVMAMYHMIRDHTLVSDAAQNVLARRGDIARPFPMVMSHPMPQTPEEIIGHQLRHHEAELPKVQQLLADASTPEERSIYQRAVNAINKHINWLRAFDQGRQVQIGHFGPTPSLSRIAGYRETASLRQGNQGQRRTTRQRARRGSRRR